MADQSLRVLVVDDTIVYRRILSSIIEGLPGTVLAATAPNGKIALAKMESAEVDLVLLDVEMPVLDGVSATQAIRAREQANGATRPLPIIAMTANALQEDRDRCMAAGMDGYIAKPVNLRALQTELRRVGSLQLG